MFSIETKPALIDQVYEQIKQAIINGDLPASAPLAQEPLPRVWGSRAGRHALALLEKDGLVVERTQGAHGWLSG